MPQALFEHLFKMTDIQQIFREISATSFSASLYLVAPSNCAQTCGAACRDSFYACITIKIASNKMRMLHFRFQGNRNQLMFVYVNALQTCKP